MTHGVERGPVVWEPSDGWLTGSRMARFVGWLGEHRGLEFVGYDQLWRWSVDDIGGFWSSIAEFFEIDLASSEPVVSADAMSADWFPGATLNYAERALAGDPDLPALVCRSEGDGEDVTITYRELSQLVGSAVTGLRRAGIGRGDRVAAYLPNLPEAVVAFLATAAVGAIWSICSPDFGATSVIDRFRQIEPKLLIAADGYVYRGVAHDRRDVVRRIVGGVPSLTGVVMLPVLGTTSDHMAWSDFADGPPAASAYERLPFDHPLWVVYSSGTTGPPKGIVHGHGGVVLEHCKQLGLGMDMRPGDRALVTTSTGWIMWNLLVGGLLAGATILLYDGSLDHPDMSAPWRFVAEAGATHLLCGATFLVRCEQAGLRPGHDDDLTCLRYISPTGSPLPASTFHWVYDAVGEWPLLGLGSGGTDVASGIVGASPLLPVRAGEMQCRQLGVAADAFDEDGLPVVDELGELVITRPMPSMPLFFWNDPGGVRYRASYFDTYPGVWRHGDWIRFTTDGACVITGRSDATLKRRGIRMGTAEFYRVVEAMAEIEDSLVVDTSGVGIEGEIILFVVAAAGVPVDETLIGQITARIRDELSPRHVPDQVRQITEVPRTLTGKKLEVPVRRILGGSPLDQAVVSGATANPAALAPFVALARHMRRRGGTPMG